MGEMYRFRTIKHLLGKEYEELERQTIYFASPEQLDDPVEGFRDIIWAGDRIVWANLFKHYTYCLHSTFLASLLFGNDCALSVRDVPILGRWNEHETAELQDLFNQIWRRVETEVEVSALVAKLANVEHDIRFNELLWYLSAVHLQLLSKIREVYVEKGILTQSENATARAFSEASILTNSNFFENLPKLKEEDFYQNLHSDQRDNFYEIFFSIPNKIRSESLLAHKYHRYRTFPDSPSEANLKMLIFDFPEIYLKDLEKLLWPQWYTACFVRHYNNSSMWGNYTKGHEGACLIFQTDDSENGASLSLNRVVGFSSNSEGNSKELWDLSRMTFNRVDYADKRGVVDFFRSLGRLPLPTIMEMWYSDEAGNVSDCASHIDSNLDYGPWQKSYWENFLRDITIKTRDWQYEEEERLILYSSLLPELDEDNRALTYDFSSLTGIVFGIKMTDENKLKVMEVIERKCRKLGRREFKFYQAYYSPTDGDIQKREVNIKFV